MSTVSFIVPTLGRPSLIATLKSIELYPGDEVLVVGNVKDAVHEAVVGAQIHYVHHFPGGDWGHTERNDAMRLCRGDYIAHIDDDDVYAPGTRRVMQHAIEQTPNRPLIFRMRYPNGITLWREPRIACGNLGTPCFVHPNDPAKHGVWGSFVGGDCHFLETSKWALSDYVWRSEIIALLGHNV